MFLNQYMISVLTPYYAIGEQTDFTIAMIPSDVGIPIVLGQ